MANVTPLSLAALDEHIDLLCGCNVQLWKVLTLIGFSIRRGEEMVCPQHGVGIAYDIYLRRLALAFLDFVSSPEGRMLYPDFFLN